MDQLTIYHFLDIKQDELYKLLTKLQINEEYNFSFGQVKKNESGLLEFRNIQLEKAFKKLIDCYYFILEFEKTKNKGGLF